MSSARTIISALPLAVLLLAGPAIAETPDSSAGAVATGDITAAATAPRPHTLAVERLVLPSDLETPEPIRVKFEGFLLDQLRTAGFEVIPPDRYEPLRTAVTDSMGGFYDAESGEIDSVRFEAVGRAIREATRSRLSADATVKAGIVVVPVAFRGGPKIRWHGSEDNIGATGSGTVTAYSFVVAVTSVGGDDIHFGIGGLQLVKKAKKKSFLSSDLVLKDVERKDLFTKEEKNLHAVRYALTPFAADEKGKD